jgi:hypothetical protein
MILEYPYLTELYNKKIEENIICLIQSVSKNYISYYVLNELRETDKEKFKNLVSQWWKLKPTLPISVYYKQLFNQFDYCKKYLNNNEYIIVNGFEGIRLKNLPEKRIKRKIIHLE